MGRSRTKPGMGNWNNWMDVSLYRLHVQFISDFKLIITYLKYSPTYPVYPNKAEQDYEADQECIRRERQPRKGEGML